MLIPLGRYILQSHLRILAIKDAIIYVKIISFNDDIKRACVGDNFHGGKILLRKSTNICAKKKC